MKLSFTFEEYLEADDHLLPCAVQEIEDKTTDTDDEEETAAYKPIPKHCNVWIHANSSLVAFLAYQSCQKPLGTRKFYPILPVNQDFKSIVQVYFMDNACSFLFCRY